MAKNNFSSPVNMPSFSTFKQAPSSKEPESSKVEEKPEDKIDNVKQQETKKAPAVEQVVKQEVISEASDDLESVKQKFSGKRSPFSTSLSEETHNRIKRMSLALDTNVNDVVENCINIVFNKHEKEILKLLRKKLL